MPSSINFEQKVIIGKDRDSAVQTALTGNTVYSLPKWTARKNMVDLVLMIMDEDGPLPMYNMRPAKKTRNAADQFEDEQQGEYEARGQPPHGQIERVHTHNNAYPKMYDELDKRRSIAQFDDEQQGQYEARGQPPHGQIERVHTHNNAYPKMYDELDKRRSIAQVGIPGMDTRQIALRGAATYSSNQNEISKFDPTCPKCIKRKKRIEEERKKKGRVCKKCKDKKIRKESRNKLERVTKQRNPKPRKQQSRCKSTLRSRPCIICSNKCFQCYLAAETKSVSTFKSNENLLSTPVQEIVPTNLTTGINIRENNEKPVLNSKTSQKKKIGKKPGSSKSDVNPDTETGPSVSSYNSFMSIEHEPMIE
ncbi:hypothetical protein PYW08_012546 [Mythimna loreyi]|uniref:Uncharacterized protein n=1 Tax=Mythimna loreyi TaxID=667449 RepID=A0ACC2Q435_9NEOP|nr:hypothetical protein PYW08_012546 [Mythimna loreyi]